MEAQELKRKAEMEAMKAKFARSEMINTLNDFASCNESTSTSNQSRSAGKKVKLQNNATYEQLLDGIAILDPMDPTKWGELRNTIRAIPFGHDDERKNVHPRLKALFQYLIPGGDQCLYVVRYEKSMADKKDQKTIPDFSVVLKDSSAQAVESVADRVLTIEAKKWSTRARAITQALGYSSRYVIDCIDLTQSNGKILNFCIGTDGEYMWLGRIDVDLATYKATFRHTKQIKLWDSDAE